MDRHVGKELAMTRVVFYHEGNEEIVVLTLSLRGGQNGRRGNPSCLGGRGWVGGSLTGSQGLSMTRVKE